MKTLMSIAYWYQKVDKTHFMYKCDYILLPKGKLCFKTDLFMDMRFAIATMTVTHSTWSFGLTTLSIL
jgi:hypothetical protein